MEILEVQKLKDNKIRMKELVWFGDAKIGYNMLLQIFFK